MAKHDTFTAMFNEIELVVIGDINEGESGTREQPPISKSIDCIGVYYKDVEVSDLLEIFSNDWWNKIETEILEKL